MLLSIREISHQKQTRKHNCVSTCLSVVTGFAEEYIADEISKQGYSAPYPTEAAVKFLCRNGVHMEKVGGSIYSPLIEGGVYLVTCPSSINPKSAHMIVACVIEGSVMIRDPAVDLEDEQIYSSQDWRNGEIPCFEYFLLTDCNL